VTDPTAANSAAPQPDPSAQETPAQETSARNSSVQAPAAPGAPPRSEKPLMLQRRFLPMWTALALGAFTDNMLKQALSVGLVFGVISAPFISNDDALPIIGSFFPIAMLMFSTIAGQVADKYETSMLFRRTKFVEFLLMILAAIGLLTGISAIAILALFLMGAQSAFFSPVRTGAMPKYLYTDELVRGNALCSGGLFVSVMVGLIIGSTLIPQPNGPATVSAILAVASLVGWLAIRQAPPAAPGDPDLTIDWNAFVQAKRLMGYAVSARGVLRPILGVAWYWSVGALVTVAVPLFVRDALYSDETVVATLMALFAVGAALGAGMASLFAKGRSGLGFSAAGAVVAGAMTFFVYLISAGYPAPADGALRDAGAFFSGWRAYAIAFCFLMSSISMSVFAVPLQAAVQRRAPANKRSRILAANNMINAAGAIVGSWLVLSVTRTDLGAVDLFLGICIAQGVLAAYMVRRRYAVEDGLYDEALREDGAGSAPAPPASPTGS